MTREPKDEMTATPTADLAPLRDATRVGDPDASGIWADLLEEAGAAAEAALFA